MCRQILLRKRGQHQADCNKSPKQKESIMDTASISPIEARIHKAAEVLKVTDYDFQTAVKAVFGIELDAIGLQLLDAQTTTEQVIVELFNGYPYPKLALLAAAAILKGKDPFVLAKEEEPAKVSKGSNILTPIVKDSAVEGAVVAHQFIELAKTLRDPKQMKDKELLELYDSERDYEIEQELHRRSSFQHWVVLRPGQEGSFKKAIDIEMSLELLKRSRRMVNPTLVRQGDIFVNVYRITELNPEEQVVEICSFCGEIIYKNFCEKCSADFGNTGDDEKAFIKLITEMESFDKNSMSDRRAVLASASKGLMDLKVTWPRVNKRFEELKSLGDTSKVEEE